MMKFINLLIVFPIVCFLSSCASDYKKYREAPIKPYINTLKISHHKNIYQHPTYGELEVKDEPLKSLSEECTIKAYKGKVVEFDGVVISDPDILYEIQSDYIRHLFDRYDYFSLPAMAFRKMKRNNQDQWKITADASGIKTRCIKSQGWKFMKRGK